MVARHLGALSSPPFGISERVTTRLAKKLRVGILFGGQSAEHQVSMMSAAAVMQALSKDTYDIFPIVIDKAGRWIGGQPALTAMQQAIGEAPALPELTRVPAHRFGDSGAEPFEPDRMRRAIDVVIPVLHGPLGEDGTVQGLLELAGLPYVGSGVLGSALGMDKLAQKTMLGAEKIPQVAYVGFSRAQWHSDAKAIVVDIETRLPYPVFVKPANLGSSVGVSKAVNRSELESAIRLAARYDRRIIVEEGVDAREFEVGVLGTDAPQTSVVGEVAVHDHAFYDYEAKYVDGSSVMTIPAEIPHDISEQMRQYARQAFRILDLSGLARVDFFWERQSSGRILLNEVNTLPGFTPYSMYPLLWQASKVSYSQLLDRLIALALERGQERSSLAAFHAPGGDT